VVIAGKRVKGIPSQVIVGEKLRSPAQCQWILENIALASYAKVGGTPWVVASPGNERQLVLGVSRVQDANRAFRHNLYGSITFVKENVNQFLYFIHLARKNTLL